MTPNSMKPEMDVNTHEGHEQTVALLNILSLGNKEIERGKFRNVEDVFAELDKRIAEDEATPDDTVEWETIKTESQARWLR
ncbi:MAG: hypothetical protein Q8L69_02840 [Gallionellaceae bacterium]|nr:hypothetical protein [Gallionellaceae bacterium]